MPWPLIFWSHLVTLHLVTPGQTTGYTFDRDLDAELAALLPHIPNGCRGQEGGCTPEGTAHATRTSHMTGGGGGRASGAVVGVCFWLEF